MHAALTGILASRNTEPEYFTSVLYPFVFDEELSIAPLTAPHGAFWENPNDDTSIGVLSISGGSLNETIVYKTYNDGLAEPISVGALGITGGSLNETIVYKTYNDGLAEPLIIGSIGVSAGTLTETIVYQNYSGEIEGLNISTISISSGTLT